MVRGALREEAVADDGVDYDEDEEDHPDRDDTM